MTRIDSARLAHVLASLTQPKGLTDAATNKDVATRVVERAPARRDPAALKAQLRERLKVLKKSNDFAKNAAIVTVQEILRWEFGDAALQHPDFERIAGQVASTLITDLTLKKAVESVIRKLS